MLEMHTYIPIGSKAMVIIPRGGAMSAEPLVRVRLVKSAHVIVGYLQHPGTPA